AGDLAEEPVRLRDAVGEAGGGLLAEPAEVGVEAVEGVGEGLPLPEEDGADAGVGGGVGGVAPRVPERAECAVEAAGGLRVEDGLEGRPEADALLGAAEAGLRLPRGALQE